MGQIRLQIGSGWEQVSNFHTDWCGRVGHANNVRRRRPARDDMRHVSLTQPSDVFRRRGLIGEGGRDGVRYFLVVFGHLAMVPKGPIVGPPRWTWLAGRRQCESLKAVGLLERIGSF